MADSTDPDSPLSQSPEEMHWGFSYLREDIQDIRQEFRGHIHDLRGEIQGGRQELIAKIDSNYESLLRRMESRFYLTISTMVALAAAIIGSMKL